MLSSVVVTGTVVLVFRTGGAPSASDSGNLTRARSATDCDCVVVPDAVSLQSWDRSHQDRFTVTANFQRSSSRDWCRFPRIPDHCVQESHIPASSLHSTFQCTTANHAIRCTDQMLICFAVTSEPNAFEPCGLQFVDQCSWSSARNCLSKEQDWALVRHVSNLLVCCCRRVLSFVESRVLPCCVSW